MKDEEIARRVMNENVPVWGTAKGESASERNPRLTEAIAAALATARRAGFDAAKEQAAEIVDKLASRWADEWNTGGQDNKYLCGKSDGACEIEDAIRAMEPKP